MKIIAVIFLGFFIFCFQNCVGKNGMQGSHLSISPNILSSSGNTYIAASCNYSDVNAVINGPTHTAVNGDTIIIPSGSCTWGTNTPSDVALTITVGVTLEGSGQGVTTITDNIYKGNSNCQGMSPLISVNLSSNVFARISGFTIIGELPTSNCGESNEHISVSGVSQQMRVDHITFNPLGVAGVNFSGFTNGVIDHNIFNEPSNENPPFPEEVHHDFWQGVGAYGDNSWASPDTMGMPGTIANPTSAASAVYIENNTYSYSSNYFPTGCFDEESGGRLVFRFNTGCPFVGLHGLDSSGRYRSARQFEVYGNTFTAVVNPLSNMYTGVFLRGGTGMIFNNGFNDVSGSPYINLVTVTNYRDTSNDWAPWGINYTGTGCDGRGPFDTNTGVTYATGTYNGTSATTETVTDTTQSWNSNQWVGYSVINLSETLNGTSTWGSVIDSNTTNTLMTETATQGASHSWANGDSYEILKAYPCTDQVGRGAGLLLQDKISGDELPVLNSTGNSGPVNEASDPLYEWLNNHNGTNTSAIASETPRHVAQNRDYYDWTGSFTGASGVGTGPLASRPSTCTTGAGYWATDQGSWNQSGSGGQGELFVCTATNKWSLYYTPYTYPNPLVTGATPTPTPTTSPSPTPSGTPNPSPKPTPIPTPSPTPSVGPITSIISPVNGALVP